MGRHPGVLRYAVEAESEIESERASESEREEMISGRKRIGGAWALASIAVMLVAASFPAGVAAQDPSQAIPGVIDLDPSNVKDVLNGMKITIAEFYAPWCGHCKRLTPEYTKLAEMIQNDPMTANFVQVVKADCDKHRSLGEPFSVTGFPTLKILSRGIGIDEAETAFDYSGPRKAEDMFAKLKSLVEQDKKVGRHEELDKLALEFMATDDKEAFLAKVKPETEKHIEGELYYLMMEKIIKKGDGYAAKESARLGRIIQKGSITRTKFADMVLKVNVLDAFLDTESS